jgi:hypothetical protein
VVGPSTDQLHVLPPLLDQGLRELGHPTRSFAFGMSALSGREKDYYVERIARMRLPNLKYIVFDFTLDQLPRARSDSSNWYKPRTTRWHEWTQLRGVLADWRDVKIAASGRLHRQWVHIQHFLLNTFHVGGGVELLKYVQNNQSRSMWSFYRHGDSDESREKAKAYLKTRSKKHNQRMKELVSRRKTSRFGRRPKEDTFRFAGRWHQMFSEQGVVPIILLGPALNDRRFGPRPQGMPSLRFIDLNDPQRFPELYRADLHYDPTHLTYRGANLLTEELAKQLAKVMENP